MSAGAKVDVLAVMDRAISKVEASTSHMVYVGGDEGFVVRQNDLGLREARNAVAELIKKAEVLATAMSNLITARQVDYGYAQYVEDVTAALARVGGAE